MSKIKIWHGVYGANGAETRLHTVKDRETGVKRRLKSSFLIPSKFETTLEYRFLKYDRAIEFTYGVTEDGKFHAISIVHPPDVFSRRVGRHIVTTRISRAQEYNKDPDDYHKNDKVYIHIVQ